MSKLESLPLDLILDILSKLPLVSLQNLKLVSKRWHKLAQHPQLISQWLSHPRAPAGDPCLILHSYYPVPNQLYALYLFTNNENPCVLKKIKVPDELSWFDVLGSSNGWLCICDSETKLDFHAYNPLTGDCVRLPRPRDFSRLGSHLTVIAYGVDPASHVLKVLRVNITGLALRGGPRSFAEVLSIGSSSWRGLRELLPNLRPYYTPSLALVSGRLHWQCRSGIVSFDLSDETLRVVPSPCPPDKTCYGGLFVIRECLSAAVFENLRELKYDIWIMKEYGVRESWVKEYSFDLANYVTGSSTFARALCQLRNGNILLEYGESALVCFDPEKSTFSEVVVEGMPRWFRTFLHVNSASQNLKP